MVASRHVEYQIVSGRRLGKRPTDPDRLANAKRMARFLDTSTIPDHPGSVDYMSRIPAWLLGRNTEIGSCGPTAVANLALLVSTWLSGSPMVFTDDEIIDLYSRVSGYDPATGTNDDGVDMTVMLSELVRNGIGFGDRNVKAIAYAAIDPGDTDRLWAAATLFGGVLWGANLTVAQNQQLDQHPPVWDYVRRSRPWGGHAILAAATYSDQSGTVADRTKLVTWAELIDSTDSFITKQVEETYVVLFPWHLGSRQFVENVDLQTLAKDYQGITGRPFPDVVPPPVPQPTPAPVPGDDESAFFRWLREVVTRIDQFLHGRGF